MNRDLIVVGARRILTGQVFMDFIKQEKLGNNVRLFLDGSALLDFIIKNRPGLTILDVYLTPVSSLVILQELKRRNINLPVICFCQNIKPVLGVKLAKAGARGLIDFGTPIDEVEEIVLKVKAGRNALPCSVSEALDERDFELHHEKYNPIDQTSDLYPDNHREQLPRSTPQSVSTPHRKIPCNLQPSRFN